MWLKVRPVAVRSQDEAVAALRAGRIQASWFTNPAGLQAVRQARGEVFAATVSAAEPDGDASVLVVRAAAPVSLDQLLRCGRRLSLGLGEPGSLAGDLAPGGYLFAPRQTVPQACFRSVRSSDLRTNVLAVASRGLDAAISDTAALRALEAERPTLGGQIRVVWTSPNLPGDPMVWRKDLDPSVKEKVRAFLMGYGKAAGPAGDRQRKVLAALGWAAFQSADDTHLLPVREMEAAVRLEAARSVRDLQAERQAQAELARIRRDEAAAAKAGG